MEISLLGSERAWAGNRPGYSTPQRSLWQASTMAPHSDNRAGVFRRQSAGHTAFVPAPFPPGDLDLGGLHELLEKATLALGRLVGAAEILPDPDLFVYMYVRREAVLSSQIEGTEASLVDLLEYEAEMEMTGKKTYRVFGFERYLQLFQEREVRG